MRSLPTKLLKNIIHPPICAKQTLFILEIKKKRRLSINPDIHNSKVPRSANFI